MVAANPRSTPRRGHASLPVARRVGRPMLQTLRRLRTSRRRLNRSQPRPNSPTRPPRTPNRQVFPLNYSPKTAIRFINLASYRGIDRRRHHRRRRRTLQPAVAAIDAANEALERDRRHLALLCDATSTDERAGDDAARALQLTPPTTTTSSSPTRTDRTISRRSSSSPPYRPTRCSATTSSVDRRSFASRRSARSAGSILDAGWAFEHDAYLRLSEPTRSFTTSTWSCRRRVRRSRSSATTSTPTPFGSTEKALAPPRVERHRRARAGSRD